MAWEKESGVGCFYSCRKHAVMSKNGLAVDDSTRMEVKRRDLESVLRAESKSTLEMHIFLVENTKTLNILR